ncbi:hypothetical protein BGZ49_004706 [Haplosporangium sp. Z 27]|nr:hypothetical protein BGZ49_004706 [Haplosporangium sp. Z 27]
MVTFHHFLSKIANVLVYLTLLSGNLYSTFGGDENQDSPYDSKHKSYITPAAFTFYVWTVIYTLLGGLMFYQFFNDRVHLAVGWHFVFLSILNAIWLALWSTGHTFLAFIVLIFAAMAVSYIYFRLKDEHAPETISEAVFLHLPFSLYHAWIFVLLVINIFAVFSPIKEDGPSVFQIILSVAGLFFVAVTVFGYIEYREGDVAGSLVLAWYLIGVFYQQEESVIHWSSLGFGVFVAIYTLKPFVFRLFGRQSGETAPLLG